jgi:hypothetical protein
MFLKARSPLKSRKMTKRTKMEKTINKWLRSKKNRLSQKLEE